MHICSYSRKIRDNFNGIASYSPVTCLVTKIVNIVSAKCSEKYLFTSWKSYEDKTLKTCWVVKISLMPESVTELQRVDFFSYQIYSCAPTSRKKDGILFVVSISGSKTGQQLFAWECHVAYHTYNSVVLMGPPWQLNSMINFISVFKSITWSGSVYLYRCNFSVHFVHLFYFIRRSLTILYHVRA